VEILKLFPTVPKAAVELEHPLDLTPSCRRCPMANRPGLQTPCMSADGDPGGLYVVSDYPGDVEDRAKRPLIGPSGQILRALVAESWKGPVVYDNAVKCSPGPSAEKGYHESAPSRCRPYLKAILDEVKPQRILCLGSRALEGVLGRKLPVMSVRRGYTYLSDGTPVFFSFNPVATIKNKHLRRYLREDLVWALTHQPKFGPMWDATAAVVKNRTDALVAEEVIRSNRHRWFSFDVETAGELHDALQIVTAALFPAGESAGFVWAPEAMVDFGAREVLGRLLADPKLGKSGNNLKYDLSCASQDLRIKATGLRGDNRLMRKVMDTDADGDLDTLAELVGMGGHKAEAEKALADACARVRKAIRERDSRQLTLLEAGNDRGFMREDVWTQMVTKANLDDPKAYAYALLPRDVLLRYVCRDALASMLLQEWAEEQLERDAPAIRRVWRDILRPAAEAIRQVEEWGIHVDRGAIQNFQTYLTHRKQELQLKMMGWGKFDPSNPHDVGRILFDELRLKGGRRTLNSGQWATDAETLETVAAISKHPLPGLIIESKSFDKLMSNYAVGMQRYIRRDGRIHPSLMLDGARSGRLSCQDPNLQNIPRDGDSAEGKMARDCFTASPGCVLLSADYSQLELRIAAALSGDEAMAQIFFEGGDFHQRTAEFIAPIVWKIGPEDVKKSHRSAAKAFNFGILYGMGDEGIAARAGCSVAEAAKIREAVMGKFHKLDRWIASQLRYARQHGCCWTWWDGERARRRPLPNIDDPDGGLRAVAEHSSWNTPIQGTGSDFCLMSLTECVRWIHEDAVPAKLVLSVHDSLMFDVEESALEEVAYHVHRIMTGWNANGVPIAIDMEVGRSWGSLQKYDTSKFEA